MEQNKPMGRPIRRLNREEIDAVCALIVSHMTTPEWQTYNKETQENLTTALDKMRQFK